MADFTEMETNFPHKHRSSSKWQLTLKKTRLQLKTTITSASQQRLTLPITVATKANFSRFQIFAMKTTVFPKPAKLSVMHSRMFSRPSKPAKPAAFGISESIKHECRVCLVYHFQNWYQSNIHLKSSFHCICSCKTETLRRHVKSASDYFDTTPAHFENCIQFPQ